MSLLCFNGYPVGAAGRSLSKKVQAWKIVEPLLRWIWTADSTTTSSVRCYKYLIVGQNGQSVFTRSVATVNGILVQQNLPCSFTVWSLKKGAGSSMSWGGSVLGADNQPCPVSRGKLQAYCRLKWLVLPCKFLDLPVRRAWKPVLNSGHQSLCVPWCRCTRLARKWNFVLAVMIISFAFTQGPSWMTEIYFNAEFFCTYVSLFFLHTLSDAQHTNQLSPQFTFWYQNLTLNPGQWSSHKLHKMSVPQHKVCLCCFLAVYSWYTPY